MTSGTQQDQNSAAPPREDAEDAPPVHGHRRVPGGDLDFTEQPGPHGDPAVGEEPPHHRVLV